MTEFQIILFSIFLVLLILLAAFFSYAETGLMALNRYRLRHKARMRNKYAISLMQLLKRPDRLLGAILIGNTFANMLASSLATLIAYHYLGDTGALISAIVLTLIVLIFSEIAPKTLAALYPDRAARLVTYPIKFFLWLLYPAVWLANAITNGLFRLFGISINSKVFEPLSREELRSVVYDTAGKISRKYQNMLLGILDLNKLTVDDVMIPRNEIVGIDIEQPWQTVVEQINKFYQGDWAPVYREDINRIIGVLYTRDVLRLLLAQNTINKESLQQFLQHPYFVPAGTQLHTQLGYFQQSHEKIAFVVDEYGEVLGMLTLNDILEEIVGDFTSSMSISKRIKLQADGCYLVDGAVSVREFNRTSEWNLPLRGPRTVNGLIIEHLEALPHSGTTVLIEGYPLEIVQVKDKRVKLTRIFPRLKEYEGKL